MLIHQKRSIIPALDTNLITAEKIVRETASSKWLGAYKVGFYLAMTQGLPKVVEMIRSYSTKPIIYDHQKAGNDIPDTGELFVSACMESGIDSAILFPFTGPVTEETWIKAAQNKNFNIMVGAWMTHAGFEESAGGNLSPEEILTIYSRASDLGVTEFVVPGTKLAALRLIHQLLQSKAPTANLSFYTPGIQTQGGSIAEILKLIPENIHFIVGRALVTSNNIGQTFEQLGLQLV
jgi:orotidine-5'-phosphate decarboxylase